jgi:hypothetical protein
MARKQKGQEAPAKDGAIFVTYVGELPAVVYLGRTFLRGVPVPVEDASAYLGRSYFEVSRADAD